MISTIKRILEYFVCAKFINEQFLTLRASKDMILLHSKYELVKGFKKICRIDICRDIISLNIIKGCVNKMNEDITICIDGERITLKISQTQDYQGVLRKNNITISTYNDKIISNTLINTNEQYRNYTKDVKEELECTNKVRYIILKKIMHSLFKIYKKKMIQKFKKIKIKIKNK